MDGPTVLPPPTDFLWVLGFGSFSKTKWGELFKCQIYDKHQNLHVTSTQLGLKSSKVRGALWIKTLAGSFSSPINLVFNER